MGGGGREETRQSNLFYFYPKIKLSGFSIRSSAVLGCSEDCPEVLSPQTSGDHIFFRDF